MPHSEATLPHAGSVRRRLLAAGLALPAAWRAVPSHAQQQPAARQDWLDLVKRQHEQIQLALQEMLSPNEQPWEKRRLQVRTVKQLLDAHQMAEENVVYPALVRAGMAEPADHLYDEEARLKVLMARLVFLAAGQGNAQDWTRTATELRDRVLEHALEHEEKDVLPKLHAELGQPQNQLLSQLFPMEFARVMPPRR